MVWLEHLEEGLSPQGILYASTFFDPNFLLFAHARTNAADLSLTSGGGVRVVCPGAARGAHRRLRLAIAQHRPAGWGSYLPSRPSATGTMVPDSFLSGWIGSLSTQ